MRIENFWETIHNSVLPATIFAEGARTGKAISNEELALINKYTRRPFERGELYTFPVLAIDDEPTRNKVQYTAQSQRLSAKKWEGIPYLFNASAASSLLGSADHALNAASQHARIYRSTLVKTPWGTTGTLVHVYTARNVSDEIESFIKKLDAGLLRESSIHVMVPEAVCSICSEKFPCNNEHYPGEKYEGIEAIVKTKGAFEPLELSAVAVPGSVVAHVMSDDEEGKYRRLSLREALGGSFKSLSEAVMKTKEQAAEDLKAAQKALTDAQAAVAKAVEDEEAARKAAADADDEPDDEKEALKAKLADAEKAKTDAEAKAAEAKTAQEKAEAELLKAQEERDKTIAPVATASANSAFKLFGESKCPVCQREGNTETVKMDEGQYAETLKGVREQAESAIKAVTDKAAEAVNEAKEAAELGRKILADLQNECVETAIKKGLKAPEDRKAYSTEISGLDYSALKVVRETI